MASRSAKAERLGKEVMPDSTVRGAGSAESRVGPAPQLRHADAQGLGLLLLGAIVREEGGQLSVRVGSLEHGVGAAVAAPRLQSLSLVDLLLRQLHVLGGDGDIVCLGCR